MRAASLALLALVASGCASTTSPSRQTSSAPRPHASSAPAPQGERVTLSTLVSHVRSIRRDDPRRADLFARVAENAIALAMDERPAIDFAGRTPWRPAPASPVGDEAIEPGPEFAPPERDSAAVAQLDAEQRESLAQFDRSMMFAVVVLQRRIAEHPSAPRTDEAIFALAHALELWRRADETRRAYMELIRRFPASPRAANGWVYFGDDYFDRADMPNARRCYERALTFERVDVGSYAAFRLGWVCANEARYADAVEAFSRAVALARGSGSANAAAVLRSAQRDALMPISRVSSSPQSILTAIEAMTEGNASETAALLERMLNMLSESAEHEAALALFEHVSAAHREWGCANRALAETLGVRSPPLASRVQRSVASLACQP